MAFSKSLQKGQIALSCQMCEESSEIKWRCLTCQSFMCSRKFKSSDKHDIVDIKDIAFHAAQSGTTPDFTNTNCRQHKDQKCCLYCKACEEQNIVQKVQIQVKEQYTTPFPHVPALVCCDDGSLWISDTGNKIIIDVKLSNGSILVNKKINIKSPDMALTPSGDLLLSTLDTNLKIIPHTTGKVKVSDFSVSPLITTAVHVSTDNKIIVGTRDDGTDFPANGPRQVVVMDIKGKYEQVHHQDKKKSLFTYPYKLTTDKDNNIYVIDRLSGDHNGRMVVLGQGGGVRGIYTGHPDINDTDHLFSPGDIVTTQSDNVIVSDEDNHTLHILNNNVQCVQYLNTEHSGIMWPRSLYIDHRGFLFIGCSTEEGKSDARIHVVQLVGSKI